MVIDGVDLAEGRIVEALDENAGVADEVMTLGNILTLRGYGLKVEAEEDKKAQTGVFFIAEGGEAVKARTIAVNEPRTLKVLVPAELLENTAYRIVVRTQGSARGSSAMLKNTRELNADFTLTARK